MKLLTEDQKENLKADLIIGAGLALWLGGYVLSYKAGKKSGRNAGYLAGMTEGANIGWQEGINYIGEALVRDGCGFFKSDSGTYAVTATKVGDSIADAIKLLRKEN